MSRRLELHRRWRSLISNPKCSQKIGFLASQTDWLRKKDFTSLILARYAWELWNRKKERKGSSRTWHRFIRSSNVEHCISKPAGQRYARGALVTSFRFGWLSEIVDDCNMVNYSSNTICDLPTFKRRDCTRHVHYNMLYMWRIHCFHLNQGNFAKLFMAVSFTLIDLLSFLFSRVLA